MASSIDLFKISICSKSEAAAQRNSIKKVFLKNSQNSQETTCARVSFLIKTIRHQKNDSSMFLFNSFEVCCIL